MSFKTICLKWGDWLPIFVGAELKCKISKTHSHFIFLRSHFMGKIANAPACKMRLLLITQILYSLAVWLCLPAPTVLECVQVKEKAKVQETLWAELFHARPSHSSLNNFLSFNHHRTQIPGPGKHHVPYAFCNLYGIWHSVGIQKVLVLNRSILRKTVYWIIANICHLQALSIVFLWLF